MTIGSPKNGSLHSRSPTSTSPARECSQSTTLAALIVRRERWVLTWKGRLLVLAAVAALTVILGRGAGAFLAITSPVGGQFLIVEGWMPTYAYREAAAQFKGIRGQPPELVVTIVLRRLVRHDRTFHAAMAVKRWLHEQGLQTTSIDIVTIGPHARRSHLLYERALGAEVKVGVIALEDRRFDRHHWWRSSVGVRAVVGEAIDYLYARLLFWTPQ